MTSTFSIALAFALGLTSLSSDAALNAAETERAVAQAQMAADDAHEQLVDRYRLAWARLTKAQKTAFAATERAWLNGGRQDEESACRAASPVQPEALARELCRLAVTERRLATFDTGQPATRLTRVP